MPTSQEQFDSKYVTSTELCSDLAVTRSSILHRRRAGGLPGAIEVRTRDGSIHLLLWIRRDIAPHLDEWRVQLRAKRAARA